MDSAAIQDTYPDDVAHCYGCGRLNEHGLPALRYVTGSLQVDYLAPTPIGVPLQVRGRPAEVGERKVVVDCELWAGGVVTVRGRVVAVLLRDRAAS
jgi:acyl-CoA thioesterase FadM